MKQYQDLLRHILEHGEKREDRTGTGTLSVFGYQNRYDLAAGFPLVTTKKNHLRSINRQAVENQLRQAERALQTADEATRSLHEKNVEILRRRLQTFDDIERSVKRVEAQLQMIENFFGLVNDQVVTMPSPEHILALDFDTLLASIEATKDILSQTAPIMSQLGSFNRELNPARASLAAERR